MSYYQKEQLRIALNGVLRQGATYDTLHSLVYVASVIFKQGASLMPNEVDKLIDECVKEFQAEQREEGD